MELTGIILAGGQSKRMKQDKGLLTYKGKKLIEYGILLLNPYVDKIIISTDNPGYSQFGYPLVPDEYKGIGPIGGLYSALKVSGSPGNLVIPCDMPDLTAEIMEKLIQHKEGQQAVVLGTSGNYRIPTVGFYRISSLKVIENQIKKNDFKLQNLIDELNAKIIRVSAEEKIRNINSPSDLV